MHATDSFLKELDQVTVAFESLKDIELGEDEARITAPELVIVSYDLVPCLL